MLLLIIILVFGLIGCGTKAPEEQGEETNGENGKPMMKL